MEGPAGLGQSAVLEALIERAGMRGMLCLFASASEAAGQVAFGVARSALGVSWPEDA